jgi:hypothetical protein
MEMGVAPIAGTAALLDPTTDSIVFVDEPFLSGRSGTHIVSS